MPPKRYYRPELDVLRFFCFLLVYVHHVLPRNLSPAISSFADACGFGVPVFFLLSSFLITELLLLEEESTTTVHLRSFYARRILRIWPLYFGFFGVCWLLGATHHLPAIPWQMTLSFFLLAGNWYFTRIVSFRNPAGILWSVSIEEQFYLLWPLLIQLGGGRGVIVGSVALLPISYGCIAWLAAHGAHPDPALWANTFTHVQFFAAGGLLALALRTRNFVLPWAARVACGLLTLAAWMAAIDYGHVKSFTSIPAASACCGYLLVLIGTVSFFFVFYGMRPGEGRGLRLLQYLGKISYGLYVFHILMIGMGERAAFHVLRLLQISDRPHLSESLVALFGLAFTLAAAWASYEWFEKPFLRWKERFTFVRSRIA
jgi:peptidoglycan/LPS O-acetylase OafA/YrhL